MKILTYSYLGFSISVSCECPRECYKMINIHKSWKGWLSKAEVLTVPCMYFYYDYAYNDLFYKSITICTNVNKYR